MTHAKPDAVVQFHLNKTNNIHWDLDHSL